MRTAQASRLPGPGTDPEAVIRQARRRQRRRYLVAGVAVVAVLAAAAAVLTAAGSGSRPQPPVGRPARAAPAHVIRPAPVPGLILGGAATAVVMWPVGYPLFTSAGGPPAYVDDLTTGHLSRRQVPGIAGGDYQPYLIRVGRWLVYVGAGGTAVISADLVGKPRVLGTTPFFAPAAAPGRIWLVRYRGGMLGQAPVRVRPAPVTGGPPGPAVTLPAGAAGVIGAAAVIRGTDAGLLLEVRHGGGFGLALWAPGGSAPANLPHAYASGASVLAATSLLVAYGTGCSPDSPCPMLRVFNVVTGRLVSFPAPPGTAGWVPNPSDAFSTISPGNQMMAAYAATRPQRNGHGRLYLIQLTGPSRRARAVPSSAAPFYARATWSAKGSWLLYQGPGGHLWAYQVTTGNIRTSSTPCCQYTAMVTVPNRPS
jgi:hypothetical protein